MTELQKSIIVILYNTFLNNKQIKNLKLYRPHDPGRSLKL